MWYTNPGWYALAISIAALVISLLTLRHRGRKIKSEVQRSLTQQAVRVNESFANLGVKGPYAHHLGIPDDQVRDFTAKAVTLLNQLNMLRGVYQNRTILGEKALQVYSKWASTILRPWIEADADLQRVWLLSKEAEDLRHPEFSCWLNKLLPILQQNSKN